MSAPRRRKLLLVEDNAAQLENLRQTFAGRGYEVASAETCAQARAQARHGFDVALVDVRLPDGDGIALAAELRQDRDGEVVLLTGFASVETAADAVRAGAFAYLVKPCAADQLLLTVEQAVGAVQGREEKRELARRAQLTERLATVGTLTAGLSHEIRNPLNAASLQLTVLDRRVHKLPPEQQEGLLEPLRLVHDEIRRLDRTLSEFLSFAKPKEYIAERVDLPQVVTRVLTLLEGAARAKQVRLERAVQEGLFVAGSTEQLQQLVVNLVLNAIDAAGAGGWVQVRVWTSEAAAFIQVDDSGPGVPAELRERIFEPFFTTKPAASGLGLPMVHNIVTLHGGTVEVSEASEGGARFLVRMPVAG